MEFENMSCLHRALNNLIILSTYINSVQHLNPAHLTADSFMLLVGTKNLYYFGSSSIQLPFYYYCILPDGYDHFYTTEIGYGIANQPILYVFVFYVY